jgi:hypothetical protein
MSETPHYYNTLNIGGQNLLLAIENAKKQIMQGGGALGGN